MVEQTESVTVLADIRRSDLIRMNLYLYPRQKMNWIVLVAIVLILTGFGLYIEDTPTFYTAAYAAAVA